MRRLVGWIGGALGGLAAYRLLRRRPQVAAEGAPAAEPDARAEELRAKLDETREADAGPEAGDDPAAPEPEESPEDRRRRVHEEGRATLDEMKSEPNGQSG